MRWIVQVCFQFRRGAGLVQAEPAISLCHAAESTYVTLAASKPGSERSPALVPDRLLTLLSIRRQRRSGRAKAVVLRSVLSHQVYSAQAVALAPIELARPAETLGMEAGMQRGTWNVGRKG
jgi:hypothetical protein